MRCRCCSQNPPGTSSPASPWSEARGQWARKDTAPCPARGQTPEAGITAQPSGKGPSDSGDRHPSLCQFLSRAAGRAEAPRAIHVHSLHRPGLLPGWSAAPSWPPPVPRGPAVNVTSLSCDLGLPACRWARARGHAEPGTDLLVDPGVPRPRRLPGQPGLPAAAGGAARGLLSLCSPPPPRSPPTPGQPRRLEAELHLRVNDGAGKWL